MSPHPNVLWSQNLTSVRLVVNLRDVDKSSVQIELPEDGLLRFEAKGTAASGDTLYTFNLPLDSEVFRSKPSCRYHPQYLEIRLAKKQPVYLKRLTPAKLQFLKIDFDRYMSQSDAENEHEEQQIKVTVENKVKRASMTKRVYLLTFNAVQTILYGYIFLKCLIGVATSSEQDPILSFLPYYPSWSNVGGVVKLAQTVAFLETINGAVGLSRSNAWPSFVQNFGRGVVVCTIIANPRADKQELGIVTYLLLVWSVIEIIRYPMYVLTLLKKKSSVLTWLRYNSFIPLYPAGIILEATTLLLSAWEYAQNHDSILPGLLLRAYMIIMIIGFSNNYKFMFKQRRKKFSGTEKLKTK